MRSLDNIWKSRDITLPTRVYKAETMVFLVVMYGCESWTMKTTVCQRTDAFELWYWRRLLRVPCTARSSNQSMLKEINPEYLLEGLMLKLKLQYFGYLMESADSLTKTMLLGKIEGRRRRGWQSTRWSDGVTDSMAMSLNKLQEMVKDKEAKCATVHEVKKSWTWLRDWTRANLCHLFLPGFRYRNDSEKAQYPFSVLCTMLAVKVVKVLELSLQCLHSAYTFQRTITTTQFIMCY